MQFPEDIDREGDTARPAGLETTPVRRSRSRVVMWSILFHAMAIAALWTVLAREPQSIKDETPVIAVDLVALAQSAPAASAGPIRPTTVPVAQPADSQPVAPAPRVERRPERPAPKPRVEPKLVRTPTPKAEVEPKKPEQPAPAAPAQSTTSQSSAASSPATSTPQPSAGGGNATGQPSANVSAVAKASYARLLLTRLQRAIVYPRRAQRRDIEGVVRVEVVLAASGALKNVRLVRTSGSDVLDEAAIELVRRVAPFPAVPRDLSPRGQDFAFVAPIQYRLN